MKLTYFFAAAAVSMLFALSSQAGDSSEKVQAEERRKPASHALKLQLVSHAHCAIFCGRDGTETGLGYATALLNDLHQLEARARTTVEAMAQLERLACWRNSAAR